MRFDVIVVGGGPAGASAAIWLAKAGLEVALLDRAHFPRDKACGEFLTPEAARLLAELGAWEAAGKAGARSVATTVLVAPNGRQTQHTPGTGEPTGYAMRRVALDAVLLAQARVAGVEVREGVAVRALCRDKEGSVYGVTCRDAQGETVTVCARLVVGADGAHSLVARYLGLVRTLPRLQRVAVVSHWNGVTGQGDTIEMRANGATVCGIDFPGPNVNDRLSANLTLVVPTTAAAQIAGRSGEFIEETLQTQFPDVSERLASAKREPTVRTIGCFGHICRPAVADGALLVGDAATFIDPFTGEGVYFALRGAQAAAETIVTALRAGDVSRARLWEYQRARRELARRYLLCDIVQAVIHRPALLNTVVRRLDRRPELAECLLAIVGDTRPPADALHPAFLWRLLAPEF